MMVGAGWNDNGGGRGGGNAPVKLCFEWKVAAGNAEMS